MASGASSSSALKQMFTRSRATYRCRWGDCSSEFVSKREFSEHLRMHAMQQIELWKDAQNGQSANAKDNDKLPGAALKEQGGHSNGDGAPDNDECEMCLAENLLRMASNKDTIFQEDGESSSLVTKTVEQMTIEMLEQTGSAGFDISLAMATGLDMLDSAATLMHLSEQSDSDTKETAEHILRDPKFSVQKLREFHECQKTIGAHNFPEDFDEFWLLLVKARLFNIFRHCGMEAYNRTVLKIRDITRQFRTAQVGPASIEAMLWFLQKDNNASA